MAAQLSLWAATPTPAPASVPSPAPTPRKRAPGACDCRHAEGPYCGALASDGGAPIAYHLARGGAQEGCPGHAPKRTR